MANSTVSVDPIRNQERAAKVTGYGPIHLRREGDRTIVAIEINGKWIDVISEFYDDNFSHFIEPLGIEEEGFRQGVLK